MKLLNHYKKNLTKSMSMLMGAGLLFMSANIATANSEDINCKEPNSQYVIGDFHQHTTYSDGSYSYAYMMEKNNAFDLDWWTQSGHGGGFPRDGRYGLDNGGDKFWDSYSPNPIIGDVALSGGHQVMWRWQSLRDYVFPECLIARDTYPGKEIFQGVEWNMPGHEHCSVGIITDQFKKRNPNDDALAEFDYKFDKNDADITGGASQGWTKSNLPNLHEKAVAAVTWLQQNHPKTSYAVPAHIERAGIWLPNKTSTGYNIEHFRDLNNAGPDVCFGFEGMPGHQVNSGRGGFGSGAVGKGTYGGVGYYSATVGGLWDALLGEGRHWWNFASSDCHLHYTDGGDDFWPGEYQKTYVFVKETDSPKEFIKGLRSGNSFMVEGDLINALNFYVIDRSNNDNFASMGGDLKLKKAKKNTPGVNIVIRFKSPAVNNNGDAVQVDHIDLIAGDITGMIPPGAPNYTNATNSSTKIIATFTENDWQENHGWKTIIYPIKDVGKSMYFRLRGTNIAANTPYETDEQGNPLLDTLATDNLGIDGVEEAYADLWFYSNPIFVKVK